MLYLANGSSPAIRAAMVAGELGQMCSPRERRTPLPGATWAFDNACFGKDYPGDDRWQSWLHRHVPHLDRCLFATAPDVVGDAVTTLELAQRWLPVIRGAGYRAALVAQDGLEDLDVPWPSLDVLFIGGTTEWKLGPGATHVVREAVARGVPVHMGRVNSRKRLLWARDLGCASADGTFLAFAPDTNLERFRRWVREPQGLQDVADVVAG